MSVARRDLRVYPKPVQDVLLQAAGVDGIEIKPLDGSHLRILNGDRGVRPIKVAAQRPAEHTLRRLEPWLDTHADGWREKEEKVDTAVGTALEEAVRRKEEELTITADPPPVSESEWRPHVSPSGKDFGFDTDGTQYKCRECGYLKAKTQGMHLHEAKHTGEASKWARAGNLGRTKKRVAQMRPKQPRQLVIGKGHHLYDALRSLADHFGMQLVPKGEDLEAVIRERDEAKARLALMKEAMEA